jgi:DNA-directed RNA polymerase subunit E'/Rpb7
MKDSLTYKKVKTRKEKLIEQGLPINFCRITVSFQKGIDRNIEMVYKALKFDANQDLHFMGRVRKELKLNEKIKFRIKKVYIIKNIGYGIYEE